MVMSSIVRTMRCKGIPPLYGLMDQFASKQSMSFLAAVMNFWWLRNKFRDEGRSYQNIILVVRGVREETLAMERI